MLVEDKPSLDEALLIHYGIKGMKWGRRRGKSVTGLKRRQAALIDRNERIKFQNKKMMRGEKYKLSTKLVKKMIGENEFKSRMNMQTKLLNAQNARIKSGKRTFEDKLDGIMNVSLFDLAISRTPK